MKKSAKPYVLVAILAPCSEGGRPSPEEIIANPRSLFAPVELEGANAEDIRQAVKMAGEMIVRALPGWPN